MKRKTFSAKESDIKRESYFIDAKGVVLGRLATKVATILRGKHKTIYTPHMDTGDFVTVINSDLIKATGKKGEQKVYFSHSGYPHGHKLFSLDKVKEKDSTKVIKLAVKGMLPKGSLGRQMIKKLVVHKGAADVAGKPLKV